MPDIRKSSNVYEEVLRIQTKSEISYLVRICSYNVHNSFSKLQDSELWLRSNKQRPDILVVGLQELYFNIKEMIAPDSTFQGNEAIGPLKKWIDHFDEIKSIHDNYNLLLCKSVGGLSLSVYTKKQKETRRSMNISNLLVGYVPIGILRMANKGAISIAFHYNEISVCFINCHLPAGQENSKHRQHSLQRVIQQLKLSPNNQPKSNTIKFTESDFDAVFIFGDLNSRLRGITASDAVKLINRSKTEAIERFLELDELRQIRLSDAFYKLFQEGEINFLPTYKFMLDTSAYNMKRVPSYTDRILYYSSSCVNISYCCHPELKMSDHRPISGDFLVSSDDKHILKYYKMSKAPNVTIDFHTLDFGVVEFVTQKKFTLTVTNVGSVIAEVSIRNINHGVKLPEWLTVIPANFRLTPRSSRHVQFQIFVSSSDICYFNNNPTALETRFITVSITSGADIPVYCRGEFKRNLFGLSLAIIGVLDKSPSRLKQSEIAEYEKLSKDSRKVSFTLLQRILYVLLPEIKNKISFTLLIQNNGEPSETTASLILKINTLPDIKEDIHYFYDSIDYSLVTHIEAFILFIKCLPQPLIPFKAQARLASCSLSRSDIIKIIDQLPGYNFYVVRAMSYFFNKLIVTERDIRLVTSFITSMFEPTKASVKESMIKILIQVFQSPEIYFGIR